MPVNAGDTGDPGSIPDQKDPLGKEWQPSSVFLPEKSHGQGIWWAIVVKSQTRLSN